MDKFMEKFKDAKITEKYKTLILYPLIIVALAVAMFTGFAISGRSASLGMNLGIDFTGGTMLTVMVGTLAADDVTFDINNDENFIRERDAIAALLEAQGVTISQFQRVGSDLDAGILFRYSNIAGYTDAEMVPVNEAVRQVIYERYNVDPTLGSVAGTVFIDVDYISNSAATALLRSALLALAAGIIVMLIYIAIRFKRLRYGIAAAIGLLHDVVIMIALTIVFRIQVNTSFVAVVITVIAYSLNNTIVVFDRVRENIKLNYDNKLNAFAIGNNAIKESITRAINTTVSTLFAIVMLALIGGATLREFSLPIIFGLIAGVYSTLFVVMPLWAVMDDNAAQKVKEAKRAGSPYVVAKPSLDKPETAMAGAGTKASAEAQGEQRQQPAAPKKPANQPYKASYKKKKKN